MTTLRKAAEMALEALLIWEAMRRGTIDTATAVRTPAITALRDALAAQECTYPACLSPSLECDRPCERRREESVAGR